MASGDVYDRDDGDIGEPDDSDKKNKSLDDLIANSRLPISYRSDFDGVRDEEFEIENIDEEGDEKSEESDSTGEQVKGGALSKSEGDAENPYVEVVSRLSPSELIGRFTATASPKVQEAVKTTILGLIGTLPKVAFESTTVTTGARLASLMFQLQMSGYMFKNAEYRMSLSKSLASGSDGKLKGGMVFEDGRIVDTANAQVKGKVKVRYSLGDSLDKSKDDDKDSNDDEENLPGFEVEVDAGAYMSELRDEVNRLREELSSVREAKEEAIRQDLLAYIRTLPAQQMQSLTNTISEDVMSAMRGLVNVVMQGIGDGQITPATVTEQSSEAMAQLCMWQLVIGYNLRELEVREEMKQNLLSYSKNDESSEGEIEDSDEDD
eukprot:CAMPEP_0116062200 /NCGR_PEP_ID=MMETSP0322-20121206/7594_1 /TAXON_ID=163516 /ORGANISM="Leptocylindrus danicus var. apora, Strain B651" /LENGTH=377 /DNA_ID=CAMNT_0003547415 /DNA_START=223 /DNA_END=1356 /DNA_ORIENTATION=-